MESNEVVDKSVSVSISFSDPMFSVRFQKFYLDSLGFSSDQYTTISTQLLLKKKQPDINIDTNHDVFSWWYDWSFCNGVVQLLIQYTDSKKLNQLKLMYIFKISLKLLLVDTNIFNTVSSLFRTQLDHSENGQLFDSLYKFRNI